MNIFYNTGISTYVWLLNNRKPKHCKTKVHLIDANRWYQPLQKNLGKKNCELGENDIDRICKTFFDFQISDHCRIFENNTFGYWQVTIEQPLRIEGADQHRAY